MHANPKYLAHTVPIRQWWILGLYCIQKSGSHYIYSTDMKKRPSQAPPPHTQDSMDQKRDPAPREGDATSTHRPHGPSIWISRDRRRRMIEIQRTREQGILKTKKNRGDCVTDTMQDRDRCTRMQDGMKITCGGPASLGSGFVESALICHPSGSLFPLPVARLLKPIDYLASMYVRTWQAQHRKGRHQWLNARHILSHVVS